MPLSSWFGRFVAGWRRRTASGEIPTADYYFRAALGDLIEHPGESAAYPRPIRRLAATLYEADGHLVVIRTFGEEVLSLIAARPRHRLHYVIDDMLPVAAECLELPADYRGRLARFASTLLPRLLVLKPAIVAPSPAIRSLFPDLECVHLDPCSVVPTRERPAVQDWPDGQGLRIVLLGTRSHQQSLIPLARIAEDVRAALPKARLTHFMGAIGPPALRANPIVEARRGLSWAHYRRLMERETFDIALTYLPESRFNQGRSITKALECAAFGAVGLYSDRTPFAGLVTHGTDGLLLPDAADAWSAAILDLARDPARVHRLAQGGADLAQRRGDPARVRRFWLERLGIGHLASGA